jgi:hypothetical protein
MKAEPKPIVKLANSHAGSVDGIQPLLDFVATSK